MTDNARPSTGGAVSSPALPARPFAVGLLGHGRVGGAFAGALEAAGHRVVARLRSADDPSSLADADVVVIAVRDGALAEAAAVAARHVRAGAVVLHTCGLAGTAPLSACGPHVAAVHPAIPIPAPDTPLAGAVFGVTCPGHLRGWCESFVVDLGGTPVFILEEDRVLYHAALVIASNFAVAHAADAARLVGGHQVVMPLMRRMVENIARLGPAVALTGPVVRGDAATVRAHVRALPPELIESYVASSRRALALAVGSGRLDLAGAREVGEALEEALVR